MDLVGSSGSVEIFVAAGSLITTRVPANAFAASDTCPSQKSRMLEPSAGELMYRLFTRRPVGGLFLLSHDPELNSALSLQRYSWKSERSLGTPSQTPNRTPMANSLQHETRLVQKIALAENKKSSSPRVLLR